ncbi:hypothetical protein HGRIS_008340 [Hohenbuehelia grisea]|uniref:DUF6534 domain-containing protein n=1 Tax=Hohenbuehelia grisea TaxID=104357 RepID=A0ABR3J841_9AGAR
MGYMNATLGSMMAVDFIITASLTFYLHQSRSGLRHTEKMINRIIMISVNNGIITFMLDAITLILAATQKGNLIYCAFFNVIANVYTNTILATLNSRRTETTLATATNVQMESAIIIRPATSGATSQTESKNTGPLV